MSEEDASRRKEELSGIDEETPIEELCRVVHREESHKEGDESHTGGGTGTGMGKGRQGTQHSDKREGVGLMSERLIGTPEHILTEQHYAGSKEDELSIEAGERLTFIGEELKEDPLDPSCLTLLQTELRRIVTHPTFDSIVLVVVLINTMQLGAIHRDMSDPYKYFLDISEAACTFFFLSEIVVKLTGLGPREYFSSERHLFDFSVSILSGIPYVIVAPGANNIASVRAVRALRALRVMRIVKYHPQARAILAAAVGSLWALRSILVTLIFCFIAWGMALMQLAGGRFDFPDEAFGIIGSGKPRSHFDTFPETVLSLIQIITGEAWGLILQNLLRIGGMSAIVGPPLIISFELGMKYIGMPLLVAAIIENLADARHAEVEKEQETKTPWIFWPYPAKDLPNTVIASIQGGQRNEPYSLYMSLMLTASEKEARLSVYRDQREGVLQDIAAPIAYGTTTDLTQEMVELETRLKEIEELITPLEEWLMMWERVKMDGPHGGLHPSLLLSEREDLAEEVFLCGDKLLHKRLMARGLPDGERREHEEKVLTAMEEELETLQSEMVSLEEGPAGSLPNIMRADKRCLYESEYLLT